MTQDTSMPYYHAMSYNDADAMASYTQAILKIDDDYDCAYGYDNNRDGHTDDDDDTVAHV